MLGPGVDAGHFLGERDVGLVFDVDDAVVGVFAVEAAFLWFVAVLEPVVADKVGLAQGEGDISREGFRVARTKPIARCSMAERAAEVYREGRLKGTV